MKKIYFLFSFVTVLSLRPVFSQCTETNETKVLLVGDSWASFMNTGGTINNVFTKWGFSNYKFYSNAALSVSGAETSDFMTVSKQNEIRNRINQNPSIEVVHLSIGGNDFLGDWKVSMTQAETDTMTAHVFVRLDSIIRFIKSCRPGIHVLWSGYVYPNFEEVIHDLGALGTNHPFYGTWESMEFPTFLEINNLLNEVSAQVEDYCANNQNVHFVKCTGLMQYIYGQTTALTVPPGGTYPPLSVPMPLGDPAYPSPKSTMFDYGFTKDCYHLSTQAYRDLVSYHTQKFYHKFLMDDLYLLSENNTETGTVTSQGNVSDTLFVGESGGEQFATVLSFNTTSMPDTVLTKASIFLRRKSVTGTNPIGGNMLVKIKNGNFGVTASVEAADFTAAEDGSATPCQFGSNSADGDWIRLDLPSQLLQHIKNDAATQFIISAPAATAGVMQFYNSSDPDFAPVLNIDYYQAPSAVPQVKTANELSVYPNPTTGKLTFDLEQENITDVKVNNLLGQIVLQPKVQSNSIDISSLASGTYILTINTKAGAITQRVIKD